MSLAPMTIFAYNTRHLKYSDKVRFFYALKGRGNKEGIIKHCHITQLGKTVLVLKPEYEKQMTKFLQEWGCDYKILHAMMNKEERV